jgi:N,N'-diacetyllegionaminate synthase
MVKFSNKMAGVFTIAEVGLNHNGSLKSALDHVSAAKSSGCDAVKFQTYITEKRIQDPSSPFRDLLKSLELTYEEFTEIKQFCDELGIEFFSTAFDVEAVTFLREIGVDLFKVSSFDTSNSDLFEALIGNAKRLIFSTGMTDEDTIELLTNKLLPNVDALGVLHCVSSYPTPIEHARLANVAYLNNLLPNVVIGYSDHTQGILAPSVAVGMGAQIIEKHFKVTNDHECVDAAVSIGPSDMSRMVASINESYQMVGEVYFGVSELEQGATVFKRKSL